MSIPRRKPLVVLAATAVAVGLLAFSSWPPSQAMADGQLLPSGAAGAQPGVALSSSAPTARQSLAPLGANGGFVFAPAVGVRLAFRLKAATTATLGAEDGRPPQQMELMLDGTLTLDVLDRTDLETLVAVRLAPLSVAASGFTAADQKPLSARIEAELAQETLVRWRRDGSIAGLCFPKGSNPQLGAILVSVLSASQIVLPADPQAETWECVAEDAQGPLRVRFAWLRRLGGETEPETAEIDRHDLAYVAAAQPGRPAPELRGDGRAVLDARLGWLRSVRHAQESTLRLPELRAVVKSATRVELELCNTSSCAPRALAELGDVAWATVDARARLAAYAAERELALRKERLAPYSVEALFRALAEAVRASPDDRKLLEARRQDLADKIAVCPEQIDELARALLQPGLEPRAQRLGLLAAAESQTSAGQEWISRLAEDPRLAGSLRQAAMQAVFGVKTPTEGLLAAIARVAAREIGDPDLGSTALLATGALVARAPAASQRTQLDRLLDLEGEVRRAGQIGSWLEALGNSGSAAAVEPACRYLADADPAVRASAVAALRQVDDPGVRAILLERAQSDRAGIVRGQAIGILAVSRQPEAVSAVGRCLATEADERVRRAAVRGLLQRWQHDSQARSMLLAVAARDPSAKLRQLVSERMATKRI